MQVILYKMKYSKEIKIRVWDKTDFDAVREILLKTWENTYTFIPEADRVAHLNSFYNKNKLNDLLNDSHSKSIIAEVDSVAAGWMKLFEDKLNNKFFISSLYILPEYQGFGIGKKLLDEAYKTANRKNFSEIWLGVMKQNLKAVEWYKKSGFVFTIEEPFRMGSTEVIHLIGYKSLN